MWPHRWRTIIIPHLWYFSTCFSWFSLCSFLLMWLSISQTSTQQEKSDLGAKRDIDGMGVPEIKYGDTVCFIMHVATGLWLSYLAPDAKSSRLGPLKRRVSFLCGAVKQHTHADWNSKCTWTHFQSYSYVSEPGLLVGFSSNYNSESVALCV